MHGYLEGYYGCGVAYAYKMYYRRGLEHGEYQEWGEDGMLSMEGQYIDGETDGEWTGYCLLYTSPSPRDLSTSRMPSSA